MHARNLALLQRDVSDKYNFSTVGMHEDVLWTIAGQVSSLYRSLLSGVFFCRILSRPAHALQLLRAIGFLNKHGFAHLDIKRENIVLEPIDNDSDGDTFKRLFSPLSQTIDSAASCSPCVELSKIRVRIAAAFYVHCLSAAQVHLIDFGHASHMIHFSRQIQESDKGISSFDNHCPKGYSAPEACVF
jgi:serine/threonine protein kinase